MLSLLVVGSVPYFKSIKNSKIIGLLCLVPIAIGIKYQLSEVEACPVVSFRRGSSPTTRIKIVFKTLEYSP